MSEEKTKSNRDIRIAIKSGKTISEIAKKYDISTTRVHEINKNMIEKSKKQPL